MKYILVKYINTQGDRMGNFFERHNIAMVPHFISQAVNIIT